METVQKYFTDFNETQLKQFYSLKGLYDEWNKKINVISRKDMDNFYVHHVLHSLSIAAQFNFPKNYEVMDLGSGGGFPGIPLAIFLPDAQFYLVDSINKKLKVAEAIAKEIGVYNITVMHTRAEDIHDKKFDVVVSRAVAPLKDLWQWSKPLLIKKKQAKNTKDQNNAAGLICLKGGDLSKEMAESGCRPKLWRIEKMFDEDFFKEKYILQVNAGQ